MHWNFIYDNIFNIVMWAIIILKKILIKASLIREQSYLCNAHRVLWSTADEVKLPELPHLDGPIKSSSATHRLIEGVAASLARGSTQPLMARQDSTLMRKWSLCDSTGTSRHFQCQTIKVQIVGLFTNLLYAIPTVFKSLQK